MVRHHADVCFDWPKSAVKVVEGTQGIDMAPITRMAFTQAALYAAEVGAYARLSVAPISDPGERDANRARTVAAYGKYLLALGSFYRAHWLARNPAQPPNNVPSVPGGGLAAQSGTGF